MINRRDFVKLVSLGGPGLVANQFRGLSYKGYPILSHEPISWKQISNGLYFSKVRVYENNRIVDTIAAVKIDSSKNKMRVFSEYGKVGISSNFTMENWQKKTGATVMINGPQYMADPLYRPCALVICDGNQKGPKQNLYSRGMFLAEPKDLEEKLRKADILDYDYDKFDYRTTPYTQGVQHWPILLDRDGKIKVNATQSMAKRTVVAKTNEENILFMITEKGYFTLHNFGMFLKESNKRNDNGFNVHTAMNLDGGSGAGMIIKASNMEYLNYGDGNFFNFKREIPSVIGVFER